MKPLKQPVIFSLCLMIMPVMAQENGHEFYYSFGSQVSGGLIFRNREDLKTLSYPKPYSIELSLSRMHVDYEPWRAFHTYRISGIQAGYFNFQNPDVLGSAYTLIVFSEPVISSSRHYHISVRAGGGLAYMTKIFEPERNSMNKFFSTRISFPVEISVRVKYLMAQGVSLTLSGNYHHISNGSIKVPNYGMNFSTLSAGFEYYPGLLPRLIPKSKIEEEKNISERYILWQILTGYREIYGKPVVTMGLSARYTRQFLTHFAFSTGMELLSESKEGSILETGKTIADNKKLSVMAGLNFLPGRFYVSESLAVYLYSPARVNVPVYEKFELSYRILPDFQAGIFLKTHLGDAELSGITINYILRI